jgi:outer membrane protein assembly factor BamB
MSHRVAVLFLWLSAAPGGPQGSARGEDWPQFRGPGGLGVSRDKGLPATWGPRENLVWRTELPGAGSSSPITFGPRIFLTAYSGYNVPGRPGGDMKRLKLHLVCLDRRDGTIRWSQDVAPKLPEQERIREGHGYASSTPAADRQRVYAFFGKAGVLAFDQDGRRLWRADVGSKLSDWGSAASPVLFGDLVIVNASVESEALVALDRKTGKEVWRARGIRESWSTPLLVPLAQGKTELVVPVLGKILGFDPATGEQLWSCATDIRWYMVPSLVADKGVVYALGGRSGVAALAVRAGGRGEVTRSHRLWTGRKGSNVSSPVVHEGHLYWVNDSQGIAYCAEARTGKVLYEQRLPRAGELYASPVLAEGRLYYVSRTGRTFVVAARPRFEELAQNDLGDRSTFNASPAVSDGRLLLRSERYLYCVGRK